MLRLSQLPTHHVVAGVKHSPSGHVPCGRFPLLTQRRKDFEGRVASGVAGNFCSGLALILIICYVTDVRENVLGTRKAGGNVRAGKIFEGKNVRC